jgi:uncharacterized hydantoinase/oxoprolinase family protein
MLGGDLEMTPSAETMDLAGRVFAAQRRAIAGGIHRVIGRLHDRPRTVCVSGSGAFLARAAWEDVGGAEGVRIMSVSDLLGPAQAAAACAVAVAVLATEAAWE